MKNILLSFFAILLSFTLLQADEKPNYEFKNGELLIHSSKSKQLKRSEITTNDSRSFTISTGSKIDAKVINEILFDNDEYSRDFLLEIENDFIQNNQVFIPKGSKMSGRAHIRDNDLIDFEINTLELPEGKKYSVDAEARQPNGKDYIKAKYIEHNNSGKKIAGRTFGSVMRGFVSRATNDDTMADDAMGAAGEASADEAQDAITSNRKSSYSKVLKDTKVKVIFLKSL